MPTLPIRLCLRVPSAGLLALLPLPLAAQTLVAPAAVTPDAPVPIHAEGLRPGAQAVLRVERVSAEAEGGAYRSDTTFRADARGRIMPAHQAPIAGSYRGVDAAGPFWSMAPVAGRPADVAPGSMRVSLLINGARGATAVTRVLPMAPAVRAEPVAAFPGAVLYQPSGNARRPVVIVLGGSEGGSSAGRDIGPRFAAAGMAALALPYYSPGWGSAARELPTLPEDFADIPVDRLQAVHDWIATRPDLDPARIGLYGVSKGGEFAILAAARFAWLKAVAAIVPSDVVWEGWGPHVHGADTRSSFAWGGQPLPFVPYRDMDKVIAALSAGGTGGLRGAHADGRAAHPERVAAATIPIERFAGALLVAGGEADATWPSADMARNIAARRRAHGRATTLLTFAGAGHGLSGTGWQPLRYPGQEQAAPATAAAQRRVAAATLRLFRGAFAANNRRP